MPTDLAPQRRAWRRLRQRQRRAERALRRILGMTLLSLVLVRLLQAGSTGSVADSAWAEPLPSPPWAELGTSTIVEDETLHEFTDAPAVVSVALGKPDLVRVTGTDGNGVRIRRAPQGSAPTVGAVDEGSLLQVVAGPMMDADGVSWYRVAGYGKHAVTGWAAGAFLEPAGGMEAPVRISLPVKLTAYTYQAPVGGAHGWITRSGSVVRPGVVAVDPRVIPLGSRLIIDGFDRVYVAEDTGFGVLGWHLDLFFPTEEAALRFGVQYAHAIVLN